MTIRSARLLVVCLSLAYLLMGNDIQVLLESGSDYYSGKPVPTLLFVVTAVNLLSLTVLLWCIAMLLEGNRNQRFEGFFHGVFLFPFIFAACLLIALVIRPGTTMLGDTPLDSGIRLFVSVLAPVATGLFVVRGWGRRLVGFVTTLLLFVAPFAVISVSRLVWQMLHPTPESAFAHKPLAFPVSVPASGACRVVWVLFDEMDRQIAFAERPLTVQLPEFESLRGQSFRATKASSPATSTRESIPALLTGRLVVKVQPGRSDELLIEFEGEKELAPWSTQPNIFSRARAAGFNSALAGWYHPYCRILGNSLIRCFACPYAGLTLLSYWRQNAQEFSFWGHMTWQLRRTLMEKLAFGRLFMAPKVALEREREAMSRPEQQEEYRAVLQHALLLVADPKIHLVFVHLPVPHPPGIYDRLTNDFSEDDECDYLDNLELADQALGDLRRAMEHAGVWNNTTIIISSDHPLRGDFWNGLPSFTAEVAELVASRNGAYVPFLIRLPGQKQELVYGRPLNTILTHDLILRLLQGKLTTPESIAGWIAARSENRPAEDIAHGRDHEVSGGGRWQPPATARPAFGR